MAKWQVRGLVVGPDLPGDTLRLDRSFVIQRITEQRLQDYLERVNLLFENHVATVRAQFGYLPVFSSSLPIEKLIHGKHEARVIVTAPNPPLAITQAIERSAKYLSALALVGGTQRYQFSPLVARRLAGPDGTHGTETTMSTLNAVSIYYPADLSHARTEEVKTLLSAVESDEVAQTAFDFLVAAWRLDDIGRFDAAVQKAIVSNCFLVLEKIANTITKRWREQHQEDIISEQSSIVDELLRRLDETTSETRKIAAVRDTNRLLEQATRNFQNLKLDTAGRQLGVDPKYIEAAKRLYKTRNGISHPDSNPDKEVEKWIFQENDPTELDDRGSFGEAELTAMAFLKAYASSLEEDRPTPTDD